jgi:hypothetical protein
MRRSSEPEEQAQFTVAELLARYGGPAPTAGRRHRRAAEQPADAPDVAARPAVERSSTGNREPMVRSSGPSPVPDLPTRHGAPQADSTQVSSTSGASPIPSASPIQPHCNGRTSQRWTPAVGFPPAVAGGASFAPPVVARRAPLTGMSPSDGAATDQLPRLPPGPVDPRSWSNRPVNAQPESAPPESAQLENAQLENAQPPAGPGTATRAIPEQSENAIAAGEAQAQESGSPLWEWALMVSQIGIGVVGGAALWLVCEWLWQRIPVVALIVALAVITGLVWVVRWVRRAEDLQTTVVAVLVGLFVTVSPAALLLVGR